MAGSVVTLAATPFLIQAGPGMAAWLLRSRLAASVESAVAQVRRARPHAVLGEAHQAALREWLERFPAVGSDRGAP